MQANADSEPNEPNEANEPHGPNGPNDDLKVRLLPPKPSSSTSFMDSLNVRIGMGFYGILLPIVCHIMTINWAPDPAEWQSGLWTDKLSFVLSGVCGWPVFPFLIFAMICLGQVIYDETKAFQKRWVQLGIFSGVFVCGWYLFAFSSTVLNSPFSSIGLLFGAGIWLAVVHGLIAAFIFSWRKSNPNLLILPLAALVFIVLIALVLGFGEPLVLLFAPFFLSLVLSTPLAFLVYLGMAARILVLHVPSRRFTLSQLMVWVTWFTAFASSLRMTIQLSFAEYSQLPLEPPEDCYVATAASKGYPAIVGSQCLSAAGNQLMIVNRQLATFKAAELMVRTISPKVHRVFRYFYDWLGPVAAAKLHGSLSATVVYLGLKPAEWLCRIVMRILLGRRMCQLAKQLYLARAEVAEPTGF